MLAVWLAEADQALACCSRASPTRPGIRAESVGDSNARAAPIRTTMAKMAARQPAGRRADGEQRAARGLDQLADADDAAAVVAVGDVADQQGEQRDGQELRQPDQPEVERAAGQLVDRQPIATDCIW